MRVLLTEIGNDCTGDEAICIGAARRLISMGCGVTCCYRVSLKEPIRRAGLRVHHEHMPVEEPFDGISCAEELVGTFVRLMPGLNRRMRALISKQDAVMIAPGGKFADGYKNARTLLTAAVAISMGKPVIVLHQSVGPMENPDHRKLLKEVFSRCHLVLVRDERSMDFLNELGIPGERLMSCRDVVMAEEYAPPDTESYDLGINVRCGFNGHVKTEFLLRFLNNYSNLRPRNRVLVYSTTWNLPDHVVDRVAAMSYDVVVERPGYPDYLKFIGRCAINVSDSLHGTLFSMLADRPVICCQTDLKTWKVTGLHGPGQAPIEVLKGFVSPEEADKILDRVIAAEDNPGLLLRNQRSLVSCGRALCEEGWEAVGKTLRSLSPQRRFLDRLKIWGNCRCVL